MLTRNFHELDPSIQGVQGLLITTHIWEVAVEMRIYREVKALARKTDKEKGINDFLGFKIIYLFRLGQVAINEEPPICGRNSKGHQSINI